ncbi:hypothetical protein [Mesorhizobium amorphae]|uniref:hypothetical protein n=1 Tax=Mesorhizobium amorphae TaxID=71433 RepID=UPI0011123A3E|nr:hypothetical protein [Mesorhizobium amorphae]GLR40124.1 hypothetical protein GCM10007880_06400 [Mesorhizobium amorphae]
MRKIAISALLLSFGFHPSYAQTVEQMRSALNSNPKQCPSSLDPIEGFTYPDRCGARKTNKNWGRCSNQVDKDNEIVFKYNEMLRKCGKSTADSAKLDTARKLARKKEQEAEKKGYDVKVGGAKSSYTWGTVEGSFWRECSKEFEGDYARAKGGTVMVAGYEKRSNKIYCIWANNRHVPKSKFSRWMVTVLISRCDNLKMKCEFFAHGGKFSKHALRWREMDRKDRAEANRKDAVAARSKARQKQGRSDADAQALGDFFNGLAIGLGAAAQQGNSSTSSPTTTRRQVAPQGSSDCPPGAEVCR